MATELLADGRVICPSVSSADRGGTLTRAGGELSCLARHTRLPSLHQSVQGLSRCLAPSGDEKMLGHPPFPLMVESMLAEGRTGKLRVPREPPGRVNVYLVYICDTYNQYIY